MDRESDRGSSEAGSGRCTPRSVDQEQARSDTPGTIPTYQYTLDDLYELEKAPASLLVPECLEKEFIVDGTWDPEKWHRSFSGSNSGSRGGSRGPSPLAMNDPRERRGEMLRRNSGSSANPKDRLKEEKDCIILSPQRRSFGTGCHVSQQPLLQRALSNIESDRDRRDQRRIGSGRLQIDRERGSGRDQDYRTEREYRNDRGQERGSERDSRDFRNDRHSDKESRDFRNVREIERDRDRDFRNPRDRFDRDDRRFDRDRMFSRRDMDDRMRDTRDYHGSRYNHRHRRDAHREEEPEWFSSGPVSKSDTIELHGFERDRRDSDRREEQTAVVAARQQIDEEVEVSDEEEKPTEGVSVVDRNGSLETNESSSPEANQSDLDIRQNKSTPTHMNQFDFNEFFNLPGLPVPDESFTDKDPSSIGGSRFYQLYRQSIGGGQQNTSMENSRRSSVMEDEFGYLNDLLNGSKSPVIPSPPPPSATSVFDQANFLTPYASSDKQHRLEFGTATQKFQSANNSFVNALINNAVQERNRSSPTGLKNSPQDTEAKLKALLLGRLDSTSSSGNTTPGFNSPLNVPGRVKTVAELEGELQKVHKARTPPAQTDRASPRGGHNDLTAFNKLITLMQQGAARPVESPKLPVKVDPRPPSPLTHIPVQLQHPLMSSQPVGLPPQMTPPQPGLPTQLQSAPPQQQVRVIHKPEPINLQRHAAQMQNQRSSVSDIPFDIMENFPGGVLTPTSMGPPSHLGQIDATAAQKQFLEALQRNKEQQLQIRQAALQNMLHQPISTPGSQPISASKMASVQAAIQQSQQNNVQGRRSPGDPIMSFVKANPTIITKPASPTPPPQQQQQQQIPIMNFVQTGTSPRGPSPSPLQSALLSRQAPNSPRVPSPIMFSQQPPMHLSAPSPIHPVQGGSTLSQSPQPANTNTVNTIRPPSVPRVPSPQELIVHTQAILQNALIKKQLEDQKERFYKKQQERDKTVGGSARSSPGPILSTSTPVATKTAVNVAFTPTSVIRKMHSEKASEKERQRRDSIDAEMADREGHIDIDSDMSEHQSSPLRLDISQHHNIQQMPPASIPPPSVIHGMPPPPLPNQVLPNMVTVIPGLPPFNTNQLTHLPPPPPLVSTHLPPPLLSPGAIPPPPLPQSSALVTQEQIDAVKSQQIRALIGQQSPNHSQGATLAAVTSTLPTTGRPIVKGNVVSVAPPLSSQTSLSKELGHRAIVGGSTPVVSAVDVAKLMQRQHISASPHMISRGQTHTPYAIPIAGRIPLQSTPGVVPQNQGGGTNPMYIQQIVPGTNPRGYNQFQQLAGLQAQQRMMDPRTARGPHVQMSLQNQGYSPRNLTAQINLKNGPVSPVVPVSMVTVSNSGKPDNINLMKWFGNDMLKTQLPTMPPLPVQGHAQRVLTLDEIERI